MARQRCSSQGPLTKACPQRHVEEAERSDGAPMAARAPGCFADRPLVGEEGAEKDGDRLARDASTWGFIAATGPTGHFSVPSQEQGRFLQTSLLRKRCPRPPSITRWSKPSDSGITGATVTAPSRTTGVSAARPMTRMAVVPLGMMGVPLAPPRAPMLERVKVAPVRSPGRSDRALPLTPRSAMVAANSMTPRFSASRTTGTSRPSSVSTAIPTSREGWSTNSSPSRVALKARNSSRTGTRALTTKASIGMLRPWRAASACRAARRRVASMSWKTVTWGISSHEAVMLAAMVRRSIERRTRSPAAGAGASSGAAPSTAAITSSLVILPPGPVPRTEDRSMPCSLASRRTTGNALTEASPADGPPPGPPPAWPVARRETVAASPGWSPSGQASPARPMTASTAPTARVSPSRAPWCRTVPPAGAGISTTALAVSTSTRT